MGNLSISSEKAPDIVELDAFVHANSKGSIFHSSGWLSVLEKQGFSPLHFVARDGKGALKAFIPFFLTPIPNTPARIAVSLPRSEWGGVVSAPDVEMGELSRQLRKAMKMESVLKRIVSFNIATGDKEIHENLLPEAQWEPLGTYLDLDLKSTPPERIWNDVFTRDGRQRNNIRKIEKDGVTTRFATEEDLPSFYELHAQTVTHAGGPPYPFEFVSDIWKKFQPDRFKVLLSARDGTILGGSAFLCDPKSHQIWMLFGGYQRQHSTRNAANLFTWWHNLVWAEQNGYETVHLGVDRAVDSNPMYRFKKQFAPRVTARKYFVRQAMLPQISLRMLRAVRGTLRKLN
jgi:hypothetical protein